MAVSMSGSGTPEGIADTIIEGVTSSGASCELVDRIDRSLENGKVILLVFEKYYMRSSNRASLTVMITGLFGSVNVDAVGAGGGTGVFLRFSWGTEESFESTVRDILADIGFVQR